MKAMAIREAFNWVKEHRRSRVVIGSDCATVVAAINNKCKWRSSLGAIVSECCYLLSTLDDVKSIIY